MNQPPPRYRLSISTRLTLWYGLTLLVLLSLFAAFCYVNFHNSLHRDFDRHLTHERMQLLPFVRLDGPRPRFAPLDTLRSVSYRTDGVYGTYVRLLGREGEVLYRSPNFARHTPLPLRVPARAAEAAFSREWEGRPARTVYTPLARPGGGLAGWLEVTGFEWSLHRELYRLRASLLAGIVISVLFSIAGGQLLARRALRPVAALTEAASRIRAFDRGSRLPTRFGVQDELTELAMTFNRMLERLEASFERERRFTDNAAHELLTPLATMRNGVEVSLRRSRAPETYRETLGALLLDIEELTKTVQGLLQLARVERSQEMPGEGVDFSELVEAQAERCRSRAAGEGKAFDVRVRPGLHVRADRALLGDVVENLLDNALKYTPEGGRIVVALESRAGEARLSVADSGVGFTAEQAEQLFDRFYRADAAEVQARPGSGLGLAIVRAVVTAFGGSVSARSDGPHRGSTFEVRLPLCETGSGSRVKSPA